MLLTWFTEMFQNTHPVMPAPMALPSGKRLAGGRGSDSAAVLYGQSAGFVTAIHRAAEVLLTV